MAGWDDSIFGNLPPRRLPGSPYRPVPPPVRGIGRELMPVDPRQVAGGLMDQGTQAIGNFAGQVAGQPFPGIAPNVGLPNADQFGRDITAMLQSPIHGGFNPDAALHTSLAAAPLALTARTGRTAEEIATGAAPAITAYHGSPHSFDRFDINQIGTGEGAQVYGHGLYFAGNEDVAKSYRDALAPRGTVTRNGQPFDLNEWRDAAIDALDPEGPSPSYGAAKNAVGRMQKSDSWDSYMNQLNSIDMDSLNKQFPTAYKEMQQEHAVANHLNGSDMQFDRPDKGHMYQVSINADPNQFLDWDKPLSGQPDNVKSALDATAQAKLGHPINYDNFPQAESGEGLYSYFSALNAHDPANTAQTMRDAGIPGIKYLDQGSRAKALFNGAPIPTDNWAAQLAAEKLDLHGSPDAAMASLANDAANGHPYVRDVSSAAHDLLKSGQVAYSQGGTSNYVTFSDDIVSILKKYGLAGLGLTAGAGALATQQPSDAEAASAPAPFPPPQGMTLNAQPNWGGP
jgi:hypothetical protein